MTFAESNHDDFARHSVEDIQRSWRADLLSPPCPGYPRGEGPAVLKRDFSKAIKESFSYPYQKYDAMMPWCREWYFFLKCLSELHFVSSNLSKVWCCNREGSCDAALYFLTRSPHHDHRVHQHAHHHAHQHAHLHDGWSTYICLSTRYCGCVSLRHKCYWVWMKSLVAYDPIFLRKVLMPFLKRRFRIVVSMLRGSSILWTTLWINA